MNYTSNNRATISGKVTSEIQFSHEVFGEKFYQIMLEVRRLSDMSDIIPVTLSEKLLGVTDISVDQMVTVVGQFRSYNKIMESRSKLMLTVFAIDIMPIDETINTNTIELIGFVCKPPIFRTTPFNREICDILLAVNRAYNKSDYIPTIAWGRNARSMKYLSVGEQVQVFGRIQSRNYTKRLSDSVVENRIAYEVSISKISVGDNIEYLENVVAAGTSESYNASNY
ncbi:MAG TPA: single-stranded DNA-binding protein [Eubacteriales bacterium]|nr:single-stranded DNA-binding protein [Eubacteriales bacterium]